MAKATKAQETSALLAESLGDWYLALNPSYSWVTYQQEQLIPALEKLARRHGKKKLLIEIPPGHAKTDIATKHFIPWYLGNHPGHSAMCLSYSDDLAKTFGRTIKNICADPLTHSVFPGLRLNRDSRASSFFSTEQENDFYAVGFDGTIAGRRVDLLGIDDPVKSKTHAESEPIMRGQFDVYRSVVKPRLKPGGIMFMALTRYGMRDFAARVLEAEPDEWDVLTIPAENTQGRYLWAEHYGTDYYEKAKRDEDVWWTVFQQRPQGGKRNTFRAEWLCYYDPKDAKKDWNHYLICDPGGFERESDRTSLCVIAAGPEKRGFVRDWVYDRLDPDQRADACCRLIRKWKPVRFIYEEFGLVSDTFYLSKRLKKEQIVLRPIPVGKKGPRSLLSKHARICELVSDFRDGLLWLPEHLYYTTVAGETIDIVKTFVEEEYLPYRGAESIPFDDGLDMLSRWHEPELKIEFVAAAEPAERRRDERRGTWEAYY